MSFEIDLIRRGYIPYEVPPPFTSSSLANHVDSTGAALDNLAGKKWWTAPVRHNLARPGGLRRPLSIPNPIGFIRTAREIGSSWATDLEPFLSKSHLSASRPIRSTGPRAVESVGAADIERRRAECRRSSRIILHADIQNFYPSVYTHSIAWALHGKAAAKASIGNTGLLGNRIDKAVQGGQEGQTIGIPIGPDTSLIISECLLVALEAELTKKLPKLKGYRWIDDFELCFRTLPEAQDALTVLQEIASDYQLSLNPTKTRIRTLPEPQQRPGLWQLRRWEFATRAQPQATDIMGYFDELFRAMEVEPGGPIASYAIARLKSFRCRPINWSFLQSLILQTFVAEPSCAEHVMGLFALYRSRGLVIDKEAFAAATTTIVRTHAPLGHGSEVAWAVWGCITHRVSIEPEAVNPLANMDDNIVALLCLHARELGLISNLNTTNWAAAMTAAGLRSENWLLAYEASVKGWLPSSPAGDHIAGDQFFTSLRSAGVYFYRKGVSSMPRRRKNSSATVTSFGASG